MRKNWGAAGAALRKIVKKCSAAGAAELKSMYFKHKRGDMSGVKILLFCCVLQFNLVKLDRVQFLFSSVEFTFVFADIEPTMPAHPTHVAMPSWSS